MNRHVLRESPLWMAFGVLSVAGCWLGWRELITAASREAPLNLVAATPVTVQRAPEGTLLECSAVIRNPTMRAVSVLGFRSSLMGEIRAHPHRLTLAPGQERTIRFQLVSAPAADGVASDSNSKRSIDPNVLRICPIIAGAPVLVPPAMAWEWRVRP